MQLQSGHPKAWWGGFCRAVDSSRHFPAGYVHSEPITDKPVGDSLAESGLHEPSRAICKRLLQEFLATCSFSPPCDLPLSKLTGAGDGGGGDIGVWPQPEVPRQLSALVGSLDHFTHWFMRDTGAFSPTKRDNQTESWIRSGDQSREGVTSAGLWARCGPC